uniref:DRTGG domain-containing protein n=1 Tax=Globisporangium ultimum (strain ATCC 200006 / CBS 805.95 / DAOM BR144) TaxID=431595 RepID=K3WKW7_GLOUD
PPEGETVLEGKAAIAEWVKTLLETRLAVQRDGGGHVNSAYVAPINSEVSISGVDEKAGDDDQPIRIFVSGDRSQVGKSTVCLGLVGSLLRHGFAPSEIGYIKPATQCEAPQLITKFCRHHGITCCDIGPIVFYSGFTREYLKGNTEPADVLLAKAKAKVDEVGRGKKVVVVDGVGYPAVGSICGVSNAAVAR